MIHEIEKTGSECRVFILEDLMLRSFTHMPLQILDDLKQSQVPELRIPNQIQGVVGLYDVTGDWISIYDKSDLGGFYLAIGTAGNQYKNAPVVGEI